jgi:hypothetical protein
MRARKRAYSEAPESSENPEGGTESGYQKCLLLGISWGGFEKRFAGIPSMHERMFQAKQNIHDHNHR